MTARCGVARDPTRDRKRCTLSVQTFESYERLHRMPLYLHKFSGTCATGEDWSFSWWSNSTADTSNAQAAAVTWLNTFWAGPGGTDGYASAVTADVVAQLVRTSLITESTGFQTAIAETTVNLPGTATGNALPADVAIVVSLRTALANRSGRGRFYLPQPAAVTSTPEGKLGATTQGRIVAALASAWGGYNDVGTPVVYSRTMRATQTIVSFNVGDLFDTQRRRENKVQQVRSTQTMP